MSSMYASCIQLASTDNHVLFLCEFQKLFSGYKDWQGRYSKSDLHILSFKILWIFFEAWRTGSDEFYSECLDSKLILNSDFTYQLLLICHLKIRGDDSLFAVVSVSSLKQGPCFFFSYIPFNTSPGALPYRKYPINIYWLSDWRTLLKTLNLSRTSKTKVRWGEVSLPVPR